uniref:ANK_REP_REGION domain-containing protein n=1 Tax=Macrostomum lignano TaxID=282301 RepID=A0A1I8IEY7_9PLAT
MTTSSTIIQVSQPNENDVTIRIDLTFRNGQAPVTMHQQILQPQQQHSVQQSPPQHSVWQQQQPPSQQSQQLSAAAQIEQLMRNMKSLDVSRDVASPAAPPGRRAAQLLASINSQPIPKLNFENRRRKAAEAAAAADAAAGIDRSQTQVIGIPDVLDSDDWQASGSDDDAGGLDSSRRSSQQLYLPKAPPHSIDPQTTTNFSKLARGCAEGSDDDDDILRELEDGDGYNRGEVPDRRRRQLSSTTTTTLAPSPYSSNASPPGFQVHTPPSHEEHQQVQWPPQAAHEVRQQHSMTVNAEPPVQQQQPPEARRVIGNLAYGELTQKNEHGELLVHKLAREGNWPKVVAFNQRQLSNPSFGDLFAGINTPDSFGRTVLLEAVQQQNAKAVAYCCLFTSSSDRLLLPALAEAALLPAADEEIFLTVLTTLCQDLDVNGNPVLKACNKDIDSELSWGVSSRLWRFSGLTLLQLLSIQSYDEHSHSRLSKLISCGADPRRPVSRVAAPEFRPYSNCPQLAARFSPDPWDACKPWG